jgi:hypothetical protein
MWVREFPILEVLHELTYTSDEIDVRETHLVAEQDFNGTIFSQMIYLGTRVVKGCNLRQQHQTLEMVYTQYAIPWRALSRVQYLYIPSSHFKYKPRFR